MSVTSRAVDHYQPACDALERSTPFLLEALRQAPAQARPTGMRWSNAEIAAHMLSSVTEAEKSVRGVPSVYDAEGPTAALDEQMVAQVTERDPVVLADRIGERTASLLETARARSGGDPVATPRATVGVIVGLLAVDHHLHGGQFAEAAGSSWQGRVADLHDPLLLVLPYGFDPDAARGFHGSFALRLRGVEPVRYAVDDGRLTLDSTGRPDATISAEPHAFLRLSIGAVSRARLLLQGRVRITGRRPWVAARTARLFPPVGHGGVARQRGVR